MDDKQQLDWWGAMDDKQQLDWYGGELWTISNYGGELWTISNSWIGTVGSYGR